MLSDWRSVSLSSFGDEATALAGASDVQETCEDPPDNRIKIRKTRATLECTRALQLSAVLGRLR